jgi:hypothetical protein
LAFGKVPWNPHISQTHHCPLLCGFTIFFGRNALNILGKKKEEVVYSCGHWKVVCNFILK